MMSRAEQYGLCTRALERDVACPGSEALYDQALTNGLAAIVARRWPGSEIQGRQVKSARCLLAEIRDRRQASACHETGRTVVALENQRVVRADGLGVARPTLVAYDVLVEAIDRSQSVRHGRIHVHHPLEMEHVEALKALNVDLALSLDFATFELDEEEGRIELEDAMELARAQAYFRALSDLELERRASVDYYDEYALRVDDEIVKPSEFPACGLVSFVPAGFDSGFGEVAWGTCTACSFVRSSASAELEAVRRAIRRAVDDPRS